MTGTPHDMRIAYIASEPRSESTERRFFGYVASDDSESASVLEEVSGISNVEDALAWARARADHVVLSYGVTAEGVFSAGLSYYVGANPRDPLPEWPPVREVRRKLDAQFEQVNAPDATGTARMGVVEPEEIESG